MRNRQQHSPRKCCTWPSAVVITLAKASPWPISAFSLKHAARARRQPPPSQKVTPRPNFQETAEPWALLASTLPRARLQGDLKRATVLLAEAFSESRAMGFTWGVVATLTL